MCLLLALTAAVVALAAAGCGEKSASTPSWLTSYAQQGRRQPGAARGIAFVSDARHRAFVSFGSPKPNIDMRFPIGSVTKSFTATIVLQLVQEKKLSLGATLGQYLPGAIRHGNEITIRELLQHRSGLEDFEDSDLSSTLGLPSTPHIDALRMVGSRPLDFQPGTSWEYSNTNYLALGLIIEKVTGRTYGQELESRILRPLRLRSTSLATTADPGVANVPDLTSSLIWSAGAIVSDAPDLSRFFRALLSGRLLSKRVLSLMKTTDPRGSAGDAGFTAIYTNYVGDGLGIFAVDTPCGRFWGHGGDIFPWVTSASVSETAGRVVIAAAQLRPLPPAKAAFETWPDGSSLFCSPF